MPILETASISTHERQFLTDHVNTLLHENHLSPEAQELLTSLKRCIGAGNEIIVTDENEATTFTPSQVAERLGMSRTHVYTLLDRGEIPFDRVGRDRRVHLADLTAFEARRQSARRDLAEKFANQTKIRDRAASEISDLL